MALRERVDLGQAARNAREVQRHDRFRAFAYQRLGRGDVDTEVVVVDVAHYGGCAGRPDRLVVGDVVERRRDYLVAGADAGRQQRNVDRRGTGVRAHDVALVKTQVGGDTLLELLSRGAHPEPADVERVRQMLERIDPDVGNENGNFLRRRRRRHLWDRCVTELHTTSPL